MFCNRKCRTTYRQKNATAPYREVVISGRRIYQHRHVMESKLGRRLESNEHVHHIDGDPLNNSPSNLDLLSSSTHAKLHSATRSPPWVAVAEKLAATGMDTSAIAKQLGVTTRNVWRALRIRGVRLPHARQPTKIDIARARSMLDGGASLRSIGRAMGATHATVKTALDRGTKK